MHHRGGRFRPPASCLSAPVRAARSIGVTVFSIDIKFL